MGQDSVQRIGGPPSKHWIFHSGGELIALKSLKLEKRGPGWRQQRMKQRGWLWEVLIFFAFVLINNEKILITLSRETPLQTLPRLTNDGSIFLNFAWKTKDQLRLYFSSSTHCTWCVCVFRTDTKHTPGLKPPYSVAKVFFTHCPHPREPIRKQRLADHRWPIQEVVCEMRAWGIVGYATSGFLQKFCLPLLCSSITLIRAEVCVCACACVCFLCVWVLSNPLSRKSAMLLLSL